MSLELEGETKKVGIVDFGAAALVEGLGSFAAVAGSKVELSAIFGFGPF